MLATTQWTELIIAPLRAMFTAIIEYLPVLIGALLILIVGWIIAKAIALIVGKLLKALHFNKMADKAGVTQVLRNGDIVATASDVISRLVYWLIMIMVLVMTIDALGLPRASDLLASLFAYIPRVISALFVLIVAMFLAGVVSGVVRVVAENAKLPAPKLLATVCRWTILIFAATVALVQLGIASALITSVFSIILGGMALALAIAFGLGGKDAAAKYIEQLQQRRSAGCGECKEDTN